MIKEEKTRRKFYIFRFYAVFTEQNDVVVLTFTRSGRRMWNTFTMILTDWTRERAKSRRK